MEIDNSEYITLDDLMALSDEPPSPDISSLVTNERYECIKYDGDYTAEEIERLKPKPIEKIVIENGEIVEHLIFNDN